MNAIDDGLSRLEIKGVTCDSRRVESGYLFAALPGSTVDGRDYISQAIANGAVAILVPDDDTPMPDVSVPVLRDPDARRRYAQLAAAHHASQPAHIGAVTGTNGKTSVAWFARQLINAAGMPAASAGTLGLSATGPSGRKITDATGTLTTPDPTDLHADLADLAVRGVDHVVMEASSHGLDQRRLDGVRVQAAAFTNLSRDHLDYHKTEEAYLAAKLRLFDTLLMDGGVAVVNTRATYAEAFSGAAQQRGLRIVRVGASDDDFAIHSIAAEPAGLDVEFGIEGEAVSTQLPLIGAFQAENAAVALALVGALGVDVQAAITGLSELQAAPGRMQLCGALPNKAAAYVDYAHTPDALETALRALRPHTAGRIICVFGCGGDRDPGKRPEMARAVAENADVAILTDDNPRTEDPAVIRRQARVGAPDAIEIGDRREAIRHGVSLLNTGDLLLVAGKGHETGQIVGMETLPFDDAEEVQNAISEAS